MAENGGDDLKSEDMRRDRSRSRSPVGKDRESRDRFRDGPRRNRERDRDRGSRSDRDRNRAPSNCRVYVANIPFDMKWQDLKDLFREKVGEVSFVELFEEDGKPRGCGIVEFKEQELVQKAIDLLHRYEIKGRQIVVKEDFDIDRDRSGRPVPKSDRMGGSGRGGGNGGMGIMGGMGGNMGNISSLNNLGAMNTMNAMNNMGSVGKWGNTYGLSPQFLESLGISGPLTCKVFVANLDYNVTERKLREIFRMAGRVTNVDLKTDKDGKSKGHGTVEFEHPVEAVQAISMFNSQILFDRKMSVRMDKYSEKDEMQGGLPSKLPSGLKGIGMGLGSGGHPLTNIAGISALTNMTSTMGGGTAGAGMNLMGTSMSMGIGGGGEVGTGMGGLGSGMGGGGGGGGGGMSMNTGGMGTGLGGMTATGMGMTGNTSGMMGANLNAMNPGMGSAMGGGAGMGTAMGTGMGTSMGTGMGTGMASAMGSIGGSGFGGGNTNMSDMGRPDYDYMDQRDYRSTNDGFNNRGSRISDTICIRNLPTNYTWQSLRDRFRDVGDVKYAEMRGKGVGMIRFSSERDAQRAINLMDGARVEGRVIEVYLQ